MSATVTTMTTMTTTSKSEKSSQLASPVVADVGTSIADDPQFAKDTRSYEQNRQRLKNAMELVKRKACKARKASAVCPTSAPIPSEKEKRLRPDDVDPLRDMTFKLLDALDAPVSSSKDHGHLAKGEVKLLDLIITGKRRKVKGTLLLIRPWQFLSAWTSPD